MEVIRVVIADDHLVTRTGIRMALHGRGFAIVDEVATAWDAIEAVDRHRPDLCLLDVQMPGGGIQAARGIHRSHPEVAIVMLTVSEDGDDLVEALRAGARGYLLKTTSPARLPEALRGIAAGETALPRLLAHRLLEELRRSVQPGPKAAKAPLTPRERQILELLREQLSTNEIAEALSVAPVTVRTHVASLLKKLDATDRRMIVARLRER